MNDPTKEQLQEAFVEASEFAVGQLFPRYKRMGRELEVDRPSVASFLVFCASDNCKVVYEWIKANPHTWNDTCTKAGIPEAWTE